MKNVMKDIKTALAEYAAIVEGFAKEYTNGTTAETVRAEHPELDFMDDDEIVELLEHAKNQRNIAPQEVKKMREDKGMGKELVLEIYEDYGKTTAACVLEDLGYNVYPEYDEVGDRDGWKVCKDGKEYWFKEWDHFNGYIYSITLEEA